MKTLIPSAFAVAGLAIAPIAGSAEDGTVSYDDAMKCSALFALSAMGSEGSDEAEFDDTASRWFVIAMDRDGTEDGSKAEAELEGVLEKLIETVEGFETEEQGEEFLAEGFEFCEAKHALIADEIEGIVFEEE